MRAWLLALAAAALACSSAEEAPEATPPPSPSEPPAEPAPAPLPQAANAAAGKKIYATYCASCHGDRGAGDGPAAANLDPAPARHDDGSTMNALSNEHLVAVIKLGGPAVGKSPMMAPWGGTLDDQEIRDVIAFVRTLADPPYDGPPP